MIDLAAKHPDHPQAGELRSRAVEFDAASEGYWANPQTVTVKSFLGAWARARRLYSELSGEPLV